MTHQRVSNMVVLALIMPDISDKFEVSLLSTYHVPNVFAMQKV